MNLTRELLGGGYSKKMTYKESIQTEVTRTYILLSIYRCASCLELLGGGDHDYIVHKKKSLGGDDHDYKIHKKVCFMYFDHDLKIHKKKILGGDDHDIKVHKKKLLGGDDHDLKAHKKKLLGGDDHDLKAHKKKLLGGDDHDLKTHKKKLLGKDDHDLRIHKKKQLGGDDHDMKAHRKKQLGGDDHDMKNHSKKYSRNRIYIDHFHGFMENFNRSYPSKKEYKKRYRVFRTNMKKIKLLQRNEMGTAKYASEFRKLLGFRPELKSGSYMQPAEIPVEEPPKEFDWRTRGVVTEVKNQGMCGSCWAFSVTGNVEGQWAIKHKMLYSLSEQELVDCDKTDEGCNGGLPENAYKAIEDLGGLETERAYPYEAVNDKCNLDPKMIKVKVNGSVELPEDEDKMKSWLVKNGPISIGINANALQFYVGGVSHPFKFLCNPDSLDHGMLIVGYGVHITKYLHRYQPYWIVKNSWGDDWGEKGYYRVYRGDGTCGLNKMATSATVP
ncbi:putative cysteine proteinase [Armadillidium vulgare]|nr:putative cysteine proteinase [Armadillidium vulgare]